MYFDNRPCDVCGSEVELRPHSTLSKGEADGGPDERVCTNTECATNTSGDVRP
jgi:hypothetical protein